MLELIFWLVQLELSSTQLSSPNSKSEKARLSSARQIQDLKELSSAQLSSTFERGQLSSLAREPKNFQLVPPLQYGLATQANSLLAFSGARAAAGRAGHGSGRVRQIFTGRVGSRVSKF